MQIHTFKSVKAPQFRDIKKKKKRQSKKKISEYLENYISDNENAIMRRVLNKIRILRVLENKGEIVQHRVRHKVSLPPVEGGGGRGWYRRIPAVYPSLAKLAQDRLSGKKNLSKMKFNMQRWGL